MSYKAYPAYKDSGVEWLGEIPEDWEPKRLRFVAQINPSKSEVSNLDLDTEVQFLPMEAVNDDGSYSKENIVKLFNVYAGFTYFAENDVIMAKITPCYENGKGALLKSLKNGIGFGSTEFHVLRPNKCLPEFLWHITKIDSFRKLGKMEMKGAVGQQRVPDNFIREFKTAIPSHHEQTKIATFLNRQTVLIDEMIEKKSQFIELLKEKRQALITHAVTKGINPDVKMKDSGVEWLGEVPTDWNVKRTKYLFRLVTEQAPVDNQYELLSIYTDIGVKPRIELEQRGNKASTTDGYWKVKVGDLIVNKLLAWMGAIGMSAYEGVTSPAYDILRPYAGVESEYYHYLFRTIKVQRELKRWSRGLMDMRLRLYFDEFGKIYFPYPPTEQQKEIVQYIHTESDKIGSLISKTEESINLLKEKRSALITAAVTGKIDVREEA